MKMMQSRPNTRTHDKLDREISFGPFRLATDGALHCPDNVRVQLSLRLARTLFEIAARQGAAVAREELLRTLWPEDEIADDNLTRAVADLRKIFRAQGWKCLETVYGYGYRINLTRSAPDALEATAFCEEAWHRVYQRRLATLESAEHLFTQIEKKQHGYLPALIGLAETEMHRMHLGYSTTMESAPKVSAALSRALQVDPACVDALAIKGLLLIWAEWDLAGAGETLKKALELSPDAFKPKQAMAWLQLALGDFDSAEHCFKAASAANPLAMTSRAGRAFALMFGGDTRSALTVAREMTLIDPLGAVSLSLAANFEAALGDSGKAVSMAEQGFELLPESPVAGAILAYALARNALAEPARAILRTKTKCGFMIGSNTMAALAWLELGEPALALMAIESGFATRCAWLFPVLNDPRIASLNCGPLKAAIFN